MKRKKLLTIAGITLLAGSITQSCTKLDKQVYSDIPTENFYKTPEQLAAGIAPAYNAMTNIPDGNVNQLNEISSDEIIVPTRGNDWYDGGQWQSFWLHTFKPDVGKFNDAWNDINNGIGKVNFTLNILNNLADKPATLPASIAELKVLRAYYFFLFMDMYGNVPIVTDYNTNPSKVVQSTRADAYKFLVGELSTNIPLISANVDNTTYGRMTQWAGYMLLAKLYLNAQVYTGTPAWKDAADALDKVITSGHYNLQANYLDNFIVNNQGSSENIFVVPFDKVNIGGNGWQSQTLHYSHNLTYGLTGTPNNGFCSTNDYYKKFDATDKRRAQFLVGPQYAADGKTPLIDNKSGLKVVLSPYVNEISNAADTFRLAGVRSVKYQPEAGTIGQQSNDMVIFRLGDAYLMRAEAAMRLGDMATALTYINLVRTRAGVPAWSAANLTYDNLLTERAREMSWEGWRRNDLIRYEIATGSHYFTAARTPAKAQDATDNHTFLFPIPAPQLISNPNLKQNPGY